MTERRTVILQFTPEAVRELLGIDGQVLEAHVDHFAGGTLELVVASPEAAPVKEGRTPPYARDVRDYMTVPRSPTPAGPVGPPGRRGTDVFPPATVDPSTEGDHLSIIPQPDDEE